MDLYHTKITPLNIVATTAMPYYGAMNLANESLAMPWRSTTTGGNTVTITITAVTPAALLLHDCNFPSGTFQTSADGSSFATAIAFTAYADEYGRRRALLPMPGTSVKAVRFTPSGTPDNSAAFYAVGAAYLMQTKVTLPKGPKPGLSGQMAFPAARIELSNGNKTQAGTGTRFDEFSFDLQRTNSRDFSALLARVRNSTTIISFDQRRSPWCVLPVISVESGDRYRRDAVARGTVTLQLREKVN